jgi:hypothetical protein
MKDTIMANMHNGFDGNSTSASTSTSNSTSHNLITQRSAPQSLTFTHPLTIIVTFPPSTRLLSLHISYTACLGSKSKEINEASNHSDLSLDERVFGPSTSLPRMHLTDMGPTARALAPATPSCWTPHAKSSKRAIATDKCVAILTRASLARAILAACHQFQSVVPVRIDCDPLRESPSYRCRYGLYISTTETQTIILLPLFLLGHNNPHETCKDKTKWRVPKYTDLSFVIATLYSRHQKLL